MLRKIITSFVFIILVSKLVSCDEDLTSPRIDVMVAASGDRLNAAFPNTQIRVEGEGLSGLNEIILDNNINIPFNPSYNSNRSFIFTIPFDLELGSRFGLQPITFITSSGSVTKEIEILQPLPSITAVDPEIPLVGNLASVTGTWFFDVLGVTFDNQPINYNVNSLTSITVFIPETATQGADLVITTASGSVTRFLNISVGFTIINISDFDGGGLRPNWFSFGDVDSFNPNMGGGPSGNFAQLTWAGATINGFNGTSAGNGSNFLAPSNTDPTKGFIDIDVSANTLGAHVAVQLNTINGANFGFNFVVTSTDWLTYSLPLSEFKNNYGFGEVVSGNPNPSQINQINVGIVQSDTPNPTTISFDNILIKYLE